jgi:hypothetical protein
MDSSGFRPKIAAITKRTGLAERRILLARDSTSAACDGLVRAVRQAFPEVVMLDVGSFESAQASLGAEHLELVLVCLDLPPAPTGGVRVARVALATGHPVVLVTRSLRWLPSEADDLRSLPWVAPDAAAMDLECLIRRPRSSQPRLVTSPRPRLGDAAPAARGPLAVAHVDVARRSLARCTVIR